MISRTSMALALVALAAMVAGCGTKTFDDGEVEGFVEKSAKEQDIEVESVACPSNVKIKKGDSFKCTVKTRRGKEAEITVQQTSDDGKVEVQRAEFAPLLGEDAESSRTPSGKRLDVEKVEQAISENVSSASKGKITAFSVDCPSKVPLEARAKFTCKVTSKDGKTTEYTVTQTDDQGTARFEGDLRPLAP